jgi:hypothetical protein
MESSRCRIILLLACGMFVFLLACTSSRVCAQDQDRIKIELFRDINAAIKKAQQEDVPSYAPSLYEKALKLSKSAETDYRKGERLDDIRETLRDAVKAMNEAMEAANISKITLAKANVLRKEASQREYIKFAPSDFAKAERNYQAAISDIEKGDVRSAREKTDDAMKGYREVIVTAMEDGPVKEASERLDRTKSTMSREAFNTSKRILEELEDMLDEAHDKEFEVSTLLADVRAKIDDIFSALYPPFYRTPPDTLSMGSFTLIVESYDPGRQWDFTRNVMTKASGVAWTSFSCGFIKFFPIFSREISILSRTFTVVPVVRDTLTEITLEEARLAHPEIRLGESLQLDLPSKSAISTDIIKAKKDLLDLLSKPKGSIKVRFENLTIEPTARPRAGNVLDGTAYYPTVPPTPDPITLTIAGFKIIIDSLAITPTIAIAEAVLEFPPSIVDLTECRPGRVDLGTITINSSCQFKKELPDSTYGPWVMENTGITFRGKGFVADFSPTWIVPGWPGIPPMLPAWRGVILKSGITIAHPTMDTSNVGFLYGKYSFTNATVASSGITAKLQLDSARKYLTLAPLEYYLSLSKGSLQIEDDAVKEGSFEVAGQLPSSVKTEMDTPFPLHFGSFKVDSLLNTTGIVEALDRIKPSDYYTIAVRNGDFFLPAAPVALPPLYVDKAVTNRKTIELTLDSLPLPGLTIHHRDIDSLLITSKDAKPKFWIPHTRGWLNVVTQGIVGDIYAFGNEKEKVDIQCRLGQPGTSGYKSDSTFVTAFKDTVVVDFVHNAIYESYFQGNCTIPYPTGPVHVGVKIPFYDMGFTSIGACVGGNPVFADTITLDYWGLGITSKWGVVSVRTGEILYTDALITEPRHFALGFNIYWGEMRADGNLGKFFFNYNSGNQKFDGFPFTIHTASLSRFTTVTESAGGHPLLGYLEVEGDVHFSFWGSRTVTIKDYKYPDCPGTPYTLRYVRITPSCIAVQRNWGSGRANMNFTTVCYDSSDQDGFRGSGLVSLLGPLDGTVPSEIDLSSIVTNIGFCTGGIEAGVGGSVTPVLLTGAMGDIKLGPIGGCIQIIGDNLERIYIEGPMEIAGAAGWAGFGASLQINGSMTVEITPTTVSLGTVAGIAIGLADVASLQGMAGVKFTLSTTGMEGDVIGNFNTSPVQIGAAGQFSIAVGFTVPSFSFQGYAKVWVYFFGEGEKIEGAFVVALNAPRDELWALDKIGKNLTANDVLDGFGLASDARMTGFYGGGKYGKSVSLLGIISGGCWIWGGAGCFLVTAPPHFVIMANAGIEISGDVLWGLLSASLWAEMGGSLGTGFSLCGAAGIDACCCWDLICFGWSGSICIGTGGITGD